MSKSSLFFSLRLSYTWYRDFKEDSTCRWFATFRTTIHFNWWPKHQQNKGNGAWKSLINNSRTCWHDWKFIWISANNFEWSNLQQYIYIYIYIYMLYIYTIYIYADDAFIYGSSKVVILASFTVSMLHVRELKFWQICYFEKLKKKVTSIRQSIFKKYRNTTKQILL